MSKIHPERYPISMKAMLARLDRLSPGISAGTPSTSPGLLREELAGMSERELKERSALLYHLEITIADWRADGMIVFDAADTLTEAAYIPADDTIFARPPEQVTYIYFGDLAPALVSKSSAFVEGVYIREVVTDGVFAAEVTAVCVEPEWVDMDIMPYGEAVRTTSRAAVGIFPIGVAIPSREISSRFYGDPALLCDQALVEAMTFVRRSLTTSLGVTPTLSMSFGMH